VLKLLVDVHGPYVAGDGGDGRLHHGAVVGRRVDHSTVARGYTDVGYTVAVLVEENQVAGFGARGCPVIVLVDRGVGYTPKSAKTAEVKPEQSKP
jgi:hypothetical protein